MPERSSDLRNRKRNSYYHYEKFPTTCTIDTFMYNLRRKVEDDPAAPKHLVTVSWSGYKFQK